MVSIEQQIADRVNFGVSVLNQLDPNWLDKVNLQSLDLGHHNLCVGGQVFGNFHAFIHAVKAKFAISEWTPYAVDRFADACGTYVMDVLLMANGLVDAIHQLNSEYELLTKAWGAKITELRALAELIENKTQEIERELVSV